MYLYHMKSEAGWRWGWDGGDGVIREVGVGDGLVEELMTEGKPRALGSVIDESEVIKWGVPLRPTKVVCIGLNYMHHAKEMNKPIPEEPLMFMKPVSALVGHGGKVVLPEQSEEVHHEAELAMVIGRRAQGVSEEEAMEHVLGFMCANDVTARDIQRREGGRYTRAKGFDTFCPLGRGVRMQRGFDVSRSAVVARVNGREKQRGSVDDMIFGLAKIVSFVSGVMRLEVGDVILTGTPSGVGRMESGDEVEIEVEGVGLLRHTVV